MLKTEERTYRETEFPVVFNGGFDNLLGNKLSLLFHTHCT